MAVTGKFKVSKLSQNHYSPESLEIQMEAVSADGTEENNNYHKYTPSGNIIMCVDNPPALEQFELGAEYLVTFTKVVK